MLHQRIVSRFSRMFVQPHFHVQLQTLVPSGPRSLLMSDHDQLVMRPEDAVSMAEAQTY